MKILVTGGAGFIGSHVSDLYLKNGHDVAIVDNLSAGSEKNLPSQARFYAEDVCNPAIDAILQKERPDVVNHHAAQVSVGKSLEDPRQDASVNILGTLNLLESCRKNGVRKIIFASSGGAIYGNQRFHPADESHPSEPHTPYGISKMTVELYLEHYYRVHRLAYVSLRYANVYGPRQNSRGEAGVVAAFIDQLIRGESPTIHGDGRQTRDYVFVDEVAQANRAALREDVQGIFNVGTGIETDVNAVAAKISALLPGKPAFRHGPAKPGDQQKSSLKPGSLQEPEQRFALDEGLRRTVGWFLAESGG